MKIDRAALDQLLIKKDPEAYRLLSTLFQRGNFIDPATGQPSVEVLFQKLRKLDVQLLESEIAGGPGAQMSAVPALRDLLALGVQVLESQQAGGPGTQFISLIN